MFELDNQQVAIIALFRGIPHELTYLVPDSIEHIEIGSMVRVPLRNGSATGIVLKLAKLSDLEKFEFKLKYIQSKVQEEPVLTPDLIDLAYWIKQYYGCGLQTVFETMIPAVVRAGKTAMEVLTVEIKQLPSEEELEKLRKKAPQQANVCEFLKTNPEPIQKSALMKLTKVSSNSIDALAKKDYLQITKQTIHRSAFDDDLSNAEAVQSKPHILNDQQQKALDDILEDVDANQYRTRLLYGVTGSGKTEVYMQAMRKVLDNGGSCIFLVPEIALTPQTVGRLRSRLGEYQLVVWHSNLTDGQRLDAWRSLASGKAKVVVGARSCIFAPMKNIKLIIVDEEHDGAYKQDKSPRYNGRDTAVYRSNILSAVCVLGSATPSLETLYNAQTNKYYQSKITQRIDGCKLPSVIIADMKREKPNTVISGILLKKLAQRLDNNEQTILFLNRRGYSKVFECPDCNHVEECPHCSVSLTWHKRENTIKCHICGYVVKAPYKCNKCGSEKAKWRGHGTQKLEDIIATIYPNARIGRMDRDAMNKRDNYRKVLGDFRAGRLDILIGTQMIAKGLDFPRVTLVGIIDADISLHMPDFRAHEKTYQLIVQVAGRAGRGDNDGEVIIQTKKPEATPIQFAKSDDMQAFLEEELENRKEYNYPPSMRLIRHIFRSRSEKKVEFFAEKWADCAVEKFGNICQVRGPAPAPLEKSEDYYRWHIWYFCKNVKKVVREIEELKKTFKFDEDVDDTLDVDPISLM